MPENNPEWRPVQGYPHYEVNDLGEMWSHISWGRERRCSPDRVRKLNPFVRKDGYQRVTLCDLRGGNRYEHLHRIVCAAFHGPQPDGMQVRHIDGNPRNNRPENLTWGTPAENSADMVRHGKSTRGERSSAAKLTEANVYAILAAKGAGEQDADIARRFGVKRRTIRDISARRSWKHLHKAECPDCPWDGTTIFPEEKP